MEAFPASTTVKGGWKRRVLPNFQFPHLAGNIFIDAESSSPFMSYQNCLWSLPAAVNIKKEWGGGKENNWFTWETKFITSAFECFAFIFPNLLVSNTQTHSIV